MVSLLMVGQSYLERRFRWRSRVRAATPAQQPTTLENLEYAHDAR
jgi:hypothetical protein